jgi:hypothetical protein
MPEGNPGPGTDVRARLEAGEEVTWNFRPGERWLSLQLPAELGGGRREVKVHGAYTLAAVRRTVRASA